MIIHFSQKSREILHRSYTMKYFLNDLRQPSAGSHSDWLQLQVSPQNRPKEGPGHWTEQLFP